MAYVNPLIAKWKAGQPTFGAWLTTPDPSIAEYLALSGFDEVTADQQHSTIETSTTSRRSSPRSRFAASCRRRACRYNDYVSIGGALDLGAQMVIVPMVNNADEAAPGGRRVPLPAARAIGRPGPVRPQHVMGGSPQELEAAACVLMVETKDGLAQRRRDRRDAGRRLRSTSAPATSRWASGMGWDEASRTRVGERGARRGRGAHPRRSASATA